MAEWQSGYAADCKSVDLGSTPGRASIFTFLNSQEIYSVTFTGHLAQVAKLVDAGDLKSPGGNTVPVRLRPWAPSLSY